MPLRSLVVVVDRQQRGARGWLLQSSSLIFFTVKRFHWKKKVKKSPCATRELGWKQPKHRCCSTNSLTRSGLDIVRKTQHSPMSCYSTAEGCFRKHLMTGVKRGAFGIFRATDASGLKISTSAPAVSLR